MGDSIAGGFGPDPTGDGSDGLAYGGAAIPAGVAVYDGSTSALVNWPDSGAGAIPSPGHMPHIAEAFLAAGYTQVNIVRAALGGSTTAQVRSARLGTLTSLLGALELTPDLVLLATGTNDSNSEAEALVFATQLPGLYRDIEATWPARVGHLLPAVQPAEKTHADEVRATARATAALRGSRFYVEGIAADLTTDDVHLSLLGNQRQGELVQPGWAGVE